MKIPPKREVKKPKRQPNLKAPAPFNAWDRWVATPEEVLAVLVERSLLGD